MKDTVRHSVSKVGAATRVALHKIVLLCVLACACRAEAYKQDTQLERQLVRGDPNALALFPAKGYDDGAAGFFRTHGLYVVPNSERAWCTDNRHGVLNPGCYVEFSIQGVGLKATDEHGVPCGNSGRWYRAPNSNHYVPTPGPFISNAIAKDEWQEIEIAIYGEPPADRLPARSCGPIENFGQSQHRSVTVE
jgi:hypothetical protein